ncbi:DUF4325 domain-containing protein [Pedobacter jejuensis]|uniref:DUF4325 domain-containing protein n=1 Tax=Pedobacter jejuensis TaxID=1268550 RepID=A0A3N0BM07_9SPHI|nr:DUF4325 domain-containing protein [Pedobacter jejuensis]RNL49762.1 DUF4325 domain-containing protein [Pedobacter jejuensis]
MKELMINVATDFGRTLGARYIYEGKFSGELFLNNLLLPKFKLAIETGRVLQIYLDGVFGYPSSFVSGSFGKLSQDYTSAVVLQHINLISDDTLRIEKIIREVTQPNKKDPIK